MDEQYKTVCSYITAFTYTETWIERKIASVECSADDFVFKAVIRFMFSFRSSDSYGISFFFKGSVLSELLLFYVTLYLIAGCKNRSFKAINHLVLTVFLINIFLGSLRIKTMIIL